MAIQSFKRIETKYLLNEEQKDALLLEVKKHMDFDPFCVGGKTYGIENIYFDTPENKVMSISVSKPPFKQKLRARRYDNQNDCYLEIKKKNDGVVSKRRLKLSLEEVNDFLKNRCKPPVNRYLDSMVVEEIDYLLTQFNLEPYAYISYQRLGFFDKTNPEFRLTIDTELRGRKQKALEFGRKENDTEILPKGTYLVEIKNHINYPLWLAQTLSENKIFPTSFSKVGTFYTSNIKKKE